MSGRGEQSVETLAGTTVGRASRPTGSPSVDHSRGAAIGRYVVLSRLGAGSMGVVYAAYDPELDRKLALKLLHAPHDSSPGSSSHRLLREAQAMARLNHPNVGTVHDVGEHDGHVYLAMEFVEGVTLRQWCRARARSWRSILDAYVQAGRGLVAPHHEGLVHRDFKPDNVMVTGDVGTLGRVRVLDFGLATPTRTPVNVADDSAAVPSIPALSSDETNGISGTPAYMAPEQHMGTKVGAAADQFAWCVALWEALYGERPFTGTTLAELAINIVKGARQPPPAGTRVPRWLRQACERGLETDPADRFENMQTLLDLVERRCRRRRGAALVFSAGLGIAVTAAGWAVYTPSTVDSCKQDGAAIEEVWNDERRAAVAALGTDGNAGRAVQWLDQQAQEWTTARIQACRNGTVDERWNDMQLEHATWCLDQRRMELGALVDRWLSGERSIASTAVSVAWTLPEAELCLQPELVERFPLPPEEDREASQAVEARLAEVMVLTHMGSVREASKSRSRCWRRPRRSSGRRSSPACACGSGTCC